MLWKVSKECIQAAVSFRRGYKLNLEEYSRILTGHWEGILFHRDKTILSKEQMLEGHN